MAYELFPRLHYFKAVPHSETEKLLHGLKTFTKKYKKEAPVYLAGTPVTDIGIVLYGTVQIENNDLWGNKNIISLAHTGEVFAEAYACVPGEADDGRCHSNGRSRNPLSECAGTFQAFRRRKRRIFASDPQYDDNQRTQKPRSHAASYTPLPRRSAIVCSPIFPIRQDCRKTVTSTFR